MRREMLRDLMNAIQYDVQVMEISKFYLLCNLVTSSMTPWERDTHHTQLDIPTYVPAKYYVTPILHSWLVHANILTHKQTHTNKHTDKYTEWKHYNFAIADDDNIVLGVKTYWKGLMLISFTSFKYEPTQCVHRVTLSTDGIYKVILTYLPQNIISNVGMHIYPLQNNVPEDVARPMFPIPKYINSIWSDIRQGTEYTLARCQVFSWTNDDLFSSRPQGLWLSLESDWWFCRSIKYISKLWLQNVGYLLSCDRMNVLTYQCLVT